MKNLILKPGLAIIAGLGITMNVSAQDVTCDDLTWSAEAIEAYAQIDQACLEVVERDGALYAKLEAEVAAQRPTGTMLRYTHSDGSYGPADKVAPESRDFLAMIGDQPTAVRDLTVGQQVRIYVSDAYWSLPQPEPEVAAAPPPPPPPEPEPEPEPAPVVLPTTAGMLPWLAVFGALFLLLGGALRIARR